MITHPTPLHLSQPESYRGRVSELISKSSTKTVPTGLSLTAGRINRLLGSFVLATFVICILKDKLFVPVLVQIYESEPYSPLHFGHSCQRFFRHPRNRKKMTSHPLIGIVTVSNQKVMQPWNTHVYQKWNGWRFKSFLKQQQQITQR